MADKVKYPRAAALAVARELCDALKPVTQKLIVAGSLRRGRSEVGDVEILFVPAFGPWKDPTDLFAREVTRNEADAKLDDLIRVGVLEKRLTASGSTVWGLQNKFARHVSSGIPVDFFVASPTNWFNLLVVRTGGAETNKRIAMAAIQKKWSWHTYGDGFTDDMGQPRVVTSEEDVFAMVGLPYQEPKHRL